MVEVEWPKKKKTIIIIIMTIIIIKYSFSMDVIIDFLEESCKNFDQGPIKPNCFSYWQLAFLSANFKACEHSINVLFGAVHMR